MGDASAFFGEKMGNNGKRHYKAERVIMEKDIIGWKGNNGKKPLLTKWVIMEKDIIG